MQIRPLHDRVIIKRLEAETTTAFGIVQVSDREVAQVQTVKVDGEELLVMREEDIMGVLE